MTRLMCYEMRRMLTLASLLQVKRDENIQKSARFFMLYGAVKDVADWI